MTLSLRGKLVAFFLCVGIAGIALISVYLLGFLVDDKRESFRRFELSAFQERAESLESLIQYAQITDVERTRHSNEIIFLADGACDGSAPPLITVSRPHEAALTILGLGATAWTNSLDFFLACKKVLEARERHTEIPGIQLVPSKLELPAPSLALLFADEKSTRFVLVTMDGALYPVGSLVFLLDANRSIVWSADPVTELARVLTESSITPALLEQRLGRTAAGISEIVKDILLSHGPLLGRWTLAAVSRVPVSGGSYAYAFRQILLLAIAILGIGAVVAIRFSDLLARPLQELRTSTELFGSGNLDFRFKVVGRTEIDQVKSSFNAMAEKITGLISEIKKRVEVDAELDLATDVQGLLLPTTPLRMPGLEVHAHAKTEGFSGEWWGVAELGAPGQAGGSRLRAILIADVMERGTPSAIAVALLRGSAAVVESLAQAQPALASDAAWVLKMMEGSLQVAGPEKFNPSILVALLDEGAGTVRFAGRGKTGGFYIAAMEGESADAAMIVPLPPAPGFPATLPWKPGTKLVLHTPGFLAPAPDGMAPRLELLTQMASREARSAAPLLLRKFVQTRPDASRRGGFTLLVCERAAE